MASLASCSSLSATSLGCVSGSRENVETGRPWGSRFCGTKPRSRPAFFCQACHGFDDEGKQTTQRWATDWQRRHVLFGGASALLALANVTDSASAETSDGPVTVEPSLALQVDELNACSYLYPTRSPRGSMRLSWVESRKPERYSSAAPLTPDARQRIVSERFDYKNNVVISVAIGPPNFTFLKSKDPSTWDAKDVARSVLSDKSTSRMTSGQRVVEVAILDAHSQVIDGVTYWYYEYLTQKSPTTAVYSADVYRHSLAASAEREGYLYSINASALDTRWNTMGPLLNPCVESFRLTPPTGEYVPPYKDPWRFW